MYIKIVRYIEGRGVKSNNSENVVVPTSTMLIECERVEYSKHRVANFKEFETYVTLQEIFEYAIVGEWSWDTENLMHKNLGSEEQICEFVLVHHIKGDRRETLVAPNCDLYLMGNDGRTIDSLRCKR